MRKASQTKTVGRTVRLSGFENEEYTYGCLLFLVHEGPFRYAPSCIRPVG